MTEGVARVGTEEADVLVGRGGDDELHGLEGDDSLFGRRGVDDLFGGAGADWLLGGLGADNLFGGAGFDELLGDAGDDWLEGGSGDDRMDGGDGVDWVVYAGATAGVTVALFSTTAQITGGAGVDTIVSVERVYGSAFDDYLAGDAEANLLRGAAGNDILEGHDGDDALIGDAGADVLNGLDGADYMEGGEGDDAYVVDDIADVVHERIGGGHDRVAAFISHTLATRVENLQLIGQDAVRGEGNAMGNRIVGWNNDNLLSGRGGDDVLLADLGADTVHGGRGDDRLEGGFGDDVLTGGFGADTLMGGMGADRQLGGLGRDVFVFQSVFDSSIAAPERLAEFTLGEDRIDLSAIDADWTGGGDDPFVLVSAFSGQAGEARLSYDAGGNTTTLTLDVDGDGAADMFGLIIAGRLTTADTDGFVL